MPEERLYAEDEVAAIFEAAAAAPGDPQSTAVASPEGFTLAELQAIGRKAGLAPERVAEAAAALDHPRAVLRRSELGMPVAVGRTVDLPRLPTDREWEILVAELRDTFHARGRTRSEGNLRDWSNGNLYACIEPTDSGHRLRLGSTKQNAIALNRLGAGSLVAAVVMLLVMLVEAPGEASIISPLIFGVLGVLFLGGNALRQPAWAAEREAQMEHVAGRALAMLGGIDPGTIVPQPAE